MGDRHSLAILLGACALAASVTTQARAEKCTVPRDCFQDICDNPGNIVELTALFDTNQSGSVVARVDAVQIVNAERFPVPSTGVLVNIEPRLDQEAVIRKDDRLLALAGDVDSMRWLIFGRDDADEAYCLDGSQAWSLTLAEFRSVVTFGRCDQSRSPNPLARCSIPESGCNSGGLGSCIAEAVLFLSLLARRPALRNA